METSQSLCIAGMQDRSGESLFNCLPQFTSAGCGRTGTYIAISILLERLRTEGTVDVFHTVRALRLQREMMVQTEVYSFDVPHISSNAFFFQLQYEFIYKTILEYLDSFELYSNFK